MSKEIKLIPDLRFPEFVNDGKWVEEKLGDCLLQKPEYGMNAPAVPFSDSLPTYLRITDISEGGNFLSEGKVSVNREVTANDYLSEGDIVLARTGASVGKSYKYRKKDGELVFAGFLIRVKPNPKRLNSELLFQFLATSNYWEWVRTVSVRSGQPGINGAQYSNMPIALPPRVEEQQKIASCLSSLDELIVAQNDKLEALKDHKKGLMQNLFPQEGQKVPNYRFLEFEKDGEWVEKSLGDCLLQKPEYGMNAPAVPFSDSLPTYLRITDISEEGNFLSEGKVSVDREVTENDYLSEGDIVLARTGASVGKSYKYRKKDGELVFAGFLIRVKPNPKRLNSELLFQFLATSNYWEWVRAVSVRSGQPGINGTQYSNMPIDLPTRVEEQQKIASCLSALDDLITARSEKIEQLQQHKKGLMQGLFPNTSEIR